VKVEVKAPSSASSGAAGNGTTIASVVSNHTVAKDASFEMDKAMTDFQKTSDQLEQFSKMLTNPAGIDVPTSKSLVTNKSS